MAPTPYLFHVCSRSVFVSTRRRFASVPVAHLWMVVGTRAASFSSSAVLEPATRRQVPRGSDDLKCYRLRLVSEDQVSFGVTHSHRVPVFLRSCLTSCQHVCYHHAQAVILLHVTNARMCTVCFMAQLCRKISRGLRFWLHGGMPLSRVLCR